MTFDNTNGEENRGDAAVPDVFNGNFEITTAPDSPMASLFNREEAIPGWSFYKDNNGESISIQSASASGSSENTELPTMTLQDIINELSSDKAQALQNHLTKANIDLNESATKIEPGSTLIKDPQFIPLEGQLRFDLFVPKPAAPNDKTSFVKVSINGTELKSPDPLRYEIQSEEYNKQYETNRLPEDYAPNIELPAVDLRSYERAIVETDSAYTVQGQFNRLGYAQNGFETFYVDVPEDLRDETGQIEISVEGKVPVYFDNLNFGSEHLIFGVPALISENGSKQKAKTDAANFSNNYLIHKPSYSLSFNKSIKSPNWVGYRLNNIWHQNPKPSDLAPRTLNFAEDLTLPTNLGGNPFLRPIEENYSNIFDKGHLAAAADRNRSQKDYDSTFIFSNVLPQTKYDFPWQSLEKYLQDKAKDGNDIYVFAGGIPFTNEETKKALYDLYQDKGIDDLRKAGIDIPQYTWKVALILDDQYFNKDINNLNIGNGIKETIAIIAPNDPTFPYKKKGVDLNKNWERWQTSVRVIEDITKLDFFIDLDKSIQDSIETVVFPSMALGKTIEQLLEQNSTG
ncbi:DNA/RNA non-specific endonuclease [Baaleninema simplex]|uniref:DNA/RNA non-specific endonuclease n=1 Tax=Baaleninema simplex TaxID=2862350 RepID=UPI00034B8BF7|nr:DNA/RNA non-specific endonuclease [Baaleninema simplex]